MTSIYLFTLLLGIGCWLPAPTRERREWLGFLFLQSWLLLIVMLYVGNVLFGIGLSRLWYLLAAISVAGLAFRALRARRTRDAVSVRLAHPVWALMALVMAVIAANGGIEYLPFPGDETASWLRHARQIFLVDAYWSDKVDYHHGAYTNGWPTLIAFTNTMRGIYDDANGVSAGFIMQLGVMGAVFDVVRFVIVRKQLGISAAATFGLSWIAVLALLAVEASWVLVPTFQLIDEPFAFALLGCFLTATPGLCDPGIRLRCAIYLGLAFAAAYLLKIAALTFVPAAIVIVAAYAYSGYREQADERTYLQPITFALAIFIPFAIVNISWGYFKPASECNASPIELLTAGGAAAEYPLQIAIGFIDALGTFLISYKLPLSLVTVVFLTIGLADRHARWIVLAYAGFALTYTTALYFAYLTCIDVVYLGKFEALARHIRVPLRIAHVIGPIIFLMTLLKFEIAGRLLANLLSRRTAQAAMLIAIVVLAGWQVRSVDQSLYDMRTRDYQDPYLRNAIIRLKADSETLISIIQQRSMTDPRVSLVAQGGYGVEYDLVQYFGIKSRADGGSNFIYTPVTPFSWSPVRGTGFSAMTDEDALSNYWRTFDIIWPDHTDEWSRSVLKGLVNDADCAADPERYFLFRLQDNSANGAFECVAKIR